MIVEIDSSYLETVNDEADEIMGACEYLEWKVRELWERIDPTGMKDDERNEAREYIEDLERTVTAICEHAERIRTA